MKKLFFPFLFTFISLVASAQFCFNCAELSPHFDLELTILPAENGVAPFFVTMKKVTVTETLVTVDLAFAYDPTAGIDTVYVTQGPPGWPGSGLGNPGTGWYFTEQGLHPGLEDGYNVYKYVSTVIAPFWPLIDINPNVEVVVAQGFIEFSGAAPYPGIDFYVIPGRCFRPTPETPLFWNINNTFGYLYGSTPYPITNCYTSSVYSPLSLHSDKFKAKAANILGYNFIIEQGKARLLNNQNF